LKQNQAGIISYQTSIKEIVVGINRFAKSTFDLGRFVYEEVEKLHNTYNTPKEQIYRDLETHPDLEYEASSLKKIYLTIANFPELRDGRSTDQLSFWHYEALMQAKLPISKKRELKELAEEKHMPQAELRRLIAQSKEEIKKDWPDWLQWQTDWHFPICDSRFGQPYPGRIPGQILLNLLHFYTKENDLIVSVFGGSGTDIDACKYMNRRCVAFDLNPQRKEIIKHDITTGLPLKNNSVDFIFFDPPYFDAKKNQYTQEKTDLSQLEYEDFIAVIENLAVSSAKKLKVGRYAGFIIGNNPGYSEHQFIDLGFDCYQIFKKYFEPVQRIVVSYCGNQSNHTATNIENARKNKFMLAGFRDLFIMRKV